MSGLSSPPPKLLLVVSFSGRLNFFEGNPKCRNRRRGPEAGSASLDAAGLVWLSGAAGRDFFLKFWFILKLTWSLASVYGGPWLPAIFNRIAVGLKGGTLRVAGIAEVAADAPASGCGRACAPGAVQLKLAAVAGSESRWVGTARYT